MVFAQESKKVILKGKNTLVQRGVGVVGLFVVTEWGRREERLLASIPSFFSFVCANLLRVIPLIAYNLDLGGFKKNWGEVAVSISDLF